MVSYTRYNHVIQFLESEYFQPPDVIYHYTSMQGLLGILTSKSIWASQSNCLNDSSEFSLAIDLAQELIKEFQINPDQHFNLKYFLDPNRNVKSRITPNTFVCSFSENGDQLSQWRAYGSCTGGYNIGFNSSAINNNLEFQDFFSLTKCIYDPDLQREIMTKFVKDFNGKEDDPGRLMELIFLAHLFKHEGFREEAEWRMIGHDAHIFRTDRLFFRCGNSHIIPYTNINFNDFAKSIDCITIGPTPNPNQARNSVRQLCTHLGIDLDPSKIRLTNIPYRNW